MRRGRRASDVLAQAARQRATCGMCLALGILLALPIGRAYAAELGSAENADAHMTGRVDELLRERWDKQSVVPTPPASDAELLRRLYLDLAGVVPTVSDARAYLADTRPEKSAELIDRLLASPAHVTHLADRWRELMLPRRFDPQQMAGVIGLQNWLRRQFVENRRYDRIVADLLVATGGDESGPALFFTAVGLKPEELATNTARIFLGLRLDCAQCHNHPFDRWTQQDFWGYAAFFARLEQRSRNLANVRLVDLEAGEVMLPNSSTVVSMRYPGGTQAEAAELGTRRQQLAIWMVSDDNPYLSRATVNFVWAQLFGRGLVEPLDDFGDHNPASHPQLLQELSAYFAASGYDLRALYRTLCNTRAYQLASAAPGATSRPPELFAEMAIKTLSPEQLFDSLSRVGLRAMRGQQDRLSDPGRLAFMAKLQTHTQSATDFELSVPQVLTLINGPDLNTVADANSSGLLTALDAPFLDDESRVQAVFMAALARDPNDAERSQFLEYLQAAPADGRKRALGDIVWALVNSAEFALNH